jgi:membrane-associated phospholipid phosphatase
VTDRRLARLEPHVAIVGTVSVIALVTSVMLATGAGTMTALLHAVVHFDRTAVAVLNRLARQSSTFDSLIWAISRSYALQGGVMLALFWWAWFSAPDTANGRVRRQKILSSLIALYLTVVVALLMRDALPFRPRPLDDAALAFRTPFVPGGEGLSVETTSFPSGHASIFFALAAGLWSISPTLGVLGMLHATLIDCLPRVYLGLHYPSDVVAGGLLAVAMVASVNALIWRRPLMADLVAWSQRRPGVFLSVFFLMSLEIATEFATVKLLLRLLASSHFQRVVML